MKILEQSRTKLTIQSLPIEIWFFCGIFTVASLIIFAIALSTDEDRWFSYSMACFFISFSFIFLVEFGKILTIDLDKYSNIMIFKQQSILGTKITKYPIQDITGVAIEKSKGSEGGISDRVTVFFKSGYRLPLTYYSNFEVEKHKRLAKSIANFLNLTITIQDEKIRNRQGFEMEIVEHNQERLKIQKDSETSLSSAWVFSFLCVAIAIVLGILAITEAEFVAGVFCICLGIMGCTIPMRTKTEWATCIFAKNTNQCIINKKKMIGSSITEYKIKDITDVTVQKTKLNGRIEYRVALVMDSGNIVPLTSDYSPLLNDKQRIVDSIAAFLNLKKENPENISEAKPAPKSVIITKLQKLEQEIAQYQEAITINPDNPECHYRLGMALYRQGNREEARNRLRVAIDLFKNQGNSEKADMIQALLWEFGLE